MATGARFRGPKTLTYNKAKLKNFLQKSIQVLVLCYVGITVGCWSYVSMFVAIYRNSSPSYRTKCCLFNPVHLIYFPKPIITVIPYDVIQLDWTLSSVQSLPSHNQVPNNGPIIKKSFCIDIGS